MNRYLKHTCSSGEQSVHINLYTENKPYNILLLTTILTILHTLKITVFVLLRFLLFHYVYTYVTMEND